MRCKRVEGREAEAHSAPIRLFGLLLHYSLPRTEALPHGAAYGDFVYAVPTRGNLADLPDVCDEPWARAMLT